LLDDAFLLHGRRLHKPFVASANLLLFRARGRAYLQKRRGTFRLHRSATLAAISGMIRRRFNCGDPYSGDGVNRAAAKLSTVFLFDVDNTLLDNDRVAEDLKRYLTNKVGQASAGRYWEIFEQLRTELGYADYLGALQRYRVERPREPKLLAVSHFMINYPFANRLFPASLDAVRYAQRLGQAVILSDGDVVFQPRKVDQSGLHEVFEGHVLIYIHKEMELDDVEAKYPAAHYVMVDDKVRILAAIKKHWGARVTTVFPRQGHYALDAVLVAKYPQPDITLKQIGELQKYLPEQILAAAGK
jgi:FMN phosphatase YigB (HAD superfamily)